MIVAIDGPSGAGKSTVGKNLALALGINYLDTGAMYRAVAYLKVVNNLKDGEEDKLVTILANAALEFRFRNLDTLVFLNDVDISPQLRAPHISQEASCLSALSPVRKILVGLQRKICRTGDFVVEGRDIGSVVFPHTPYKFYLDATIEERAQRRLKQLEGQGVVSELEAITREIETRDYRDKHRSDSPLVQTDDAVHIDSTSLTHEQVVSSMVTYIQQKKKKMQ